MKKVIFIIILLLCGWYGVHQYQQRIEQQKRNQEWLNSHSFDEKGNLIYTKEEIEEKKRWQHESDLEYAKFISDLARDVGYDDALYARTFIDDGVRHMEDEGCEITAKIYVKNNKIDKVEAMYCNEKDVVIRTFSFENNILKIIDNRGSIHFLKVIR